MNAVRFCIVIVGLLFQSCQCWFAHDRAVVAAQRGDWGQAQDLLKRVMVDTPKDPAVLYDAGVAAYKLGEHENARAYFEAVAQQPDVPQDLKQQATFNLGNSYLGLKNPQQALEQYEKILEVSPTHVPAQHNAEIARKMIEQQKKEQQEQEKKDEQQRQDDKQSGKNKQKDKQRNRDEKKSGESKNQEEQEQQKSEQHDQSESQKDQNKGDNQAQNRSDQNESQKDRQQQGERDGNEQADQDKQGDPSDGQDDPASDIKNNKKSNERDNHKRPSDQSGQKDSSQHKQEQQKTQGAGQSANGNGGKAGQEHQPWVYALLDEQEKKEADVNKQLIKATVGKRMAGQDGQNCW